MLLSNESLFESQYRYCVIEFLGRPRIHATKRDDCQRDDGRLILQTETDFRGSFIIVMLQQNYFSFPLETLETLIPFVKDHPI